MQAEEFFVTPIEFADGDASAAKLLVKGLPEARADVQQREESGRIETAAVPESGANQVIIAGRNRFQNVEQADGRFEQLNGAPNQACAVSVIAALERFQGATEFELCALHQQFRALVHNQKSHLIFMQEFLRRLLQGEQLIGMQIALVVGRSLAGKNRFGKFVAMCHSGPVQDCKCSAAAG